MKRTGWLVKRTLRISLFALLLMTMLIISKPAIAAPMISVSPTSGASGTRVTLTGANFQSFAGDDISIFFGNTEVDGSPLTVPESGGFTLEFPVPAVATPGRYEITINSTLVPRLVSHLFTVPETKITLDIIQGTTGTAVNITGTGFYSVRMVTLYYYTRIMEKLGTVMASPVGDFSYRFTIPDSSGGKHSITAENEEENSAETGFEVTP